MSDLRRLDGERVFCHQCSNEWDRARGGLQCPRCEGEFTEIVSPQSINVRYFGLTFARSPVADDQTTKSRPNLDNPHPTHFIPLMTALPQIERTLHSTITIHGLMHLIRKKEILVHMNSRLQAAAVVHSP